MIIFSNGKSQTHKIFNENDESSLIFNVHVYYEGESEKFVIFWIKEIKIQIFRQKKITILNEVSFEIIHFVQCCSNFMSPFKY